MCIRVTCKKTVYLKLFSFWFVFSFGVVELQRRELLIFLCIVILLPIRSGRLKVCAVIELVILFRNLNAIRAIIRDHGDIIDRYKLMARIATRSRHQTATKSFYRNIAGTCSLVKFEFQIW